MEDFKMIIVIGATGYVGRYFCTEMVNRGIDVLALGRSKVVGRFFQENGVPFQYFDLNDSASFVNLPKENVDAIIDLSACLAELETPVERFFEVNAVGVYNTLDYAYKNGVKKVVVASSHKLYNDIFKDIISEDDGISFTGDHSPYIISKIAAENFVEWYNKDYDMDAVVLRFTGVHGYGEILGHLNTDGSYKKSTFEIFFENALEAKNIEVWGDQTIRRDHVYIKDIVNALYKAATSGDAKGIFNVASGIGYSQYEEALALAEVFKPANGKKSKVICRPELPGLTRGYVYDIKKAKDILGWEPEYTDLVEMYKDYRKEWETKKYHNYHYIKEGQGPASL
jgi:UDP-glucose 4-epimerase